MKFNLVKPCANCPFRKDCPKGWLGEKRIEGIIDKSLNDHTFQCHKTTGENVPDSQTSQCVGAMLFVDKIQGIFSNRMFRMAKAFRWLDEKKLKGKDLIFDSKEDALEHHKNEYLK